MESDGPTGLARRSGARRSGVSGIDGANALVAILIVIQMWLLTAALDSDLAGHDEVAFPAAIASGVLFVGGLLLYRFVTRTDRGAH